jgi:hypothetical protein
MPIVINLPLMGINLDGMEFLAQIAVRDLLTDFSYFYSLIHMVFA